MMSCGVVLLAACNKSSSDDDNNNLSARGKLLVDAKWQVIANTATLNYMGKDTTIDLYATTDECDKDDFVIYKSDGTGFIDENTNKCADDGQVENFTWALLDGDTRLALVDSNPDTVTIIELTSMQSKISITKPNSSGVPVTNTLTLKNIK